MSTSKSPRNHTDGSIAALDDDSQSGPRLPSRIDSPSDGRKTIIWTSAIAKSTWIAIAARCAIARPSVRIIAHWTAITAQNVVSVPVSVAASWAMLRPTKPPGSR